MIACGCVRCGSGWERAGYEIVGCIVCGGGGALSWAQDIHVSRACQADLVRCVSTLLHSRIPPSRPETSVRPP